MLQHHQNNLQISSNAHNSQTLTIQKNLKCASSIDCPVECKFNWLSSNFQRGSISLQFSFRGLSTLKFIVCTCRYPGVCLGSWVLGCLGMYLKYSSMYLGARVLGCLGVYFGCCRWYHVTNWKHSHFLKHSAELIHATQNLIQLEHSENNLISETCEKWWITGVKILNFREMQKGTKMIVTDNLNQQNGYSKWLSTLLLGSETELWESKTWRLTWMLMLHK